MMNAEEIIEATKSEDRLDVGQSVTLTASIYIRHFVPLVFIPSSVFLVFGLLDFANDEWDGAAYSISVSANNVFQLLSIQIAYGLGTYYACGYLSSQTTSVREAFASLWYLMIRLVSVSVVTGLMAVFASVLFFYFDEVRIFDWTMNLAYLFFNVCFVIVSAPIIIDNLSPGTAFKRVASLSNGSRPEITVFAFIILGIEVLLTVAVIFFIFFVIGENNMAFAAPIWFAIIFPFASVASTVAYLQLRQISEKSMVAVE